VQAIATLTGYINSTVISASYTLQSATPTFSPIAAAYGSNQSVTISSSTIGATIRYTTDGSTPSESNGTVYTTPISISANTTLNAIAYLNGYSDSSVVSGSYVISSVCLAPTFAPVAGTYSSNQTVVISTLSNGASIIYTTDGTTPSESNGTVFNGNVLANGQSVSISSATLLQAIAYGSGFTDSSVTSGQYNFQCATPTFSKGTDSYNAIQTVTISDTTTGATIYYTTDGTTPTTASTPYTGAITVSVSETVNAIAVTSNYSNSSVATATYTISILLHGTYIGTAGSWGGQGNNGSNAFDGNTSTFFDGPDWTGDWCGIDLGANNSAVISKISYYPRVGNEDRVNGNVFQGSNDEVTWTTLYTIPGTNNVNPGPPDAYTTTTSIGSSTAFRYLRYYAIAGGECDIAEVQFYTP
jgi:hypothetical protein